VPPLPWTSLSTAEPGRDYLVLASHLPLRKISATLRFLRFVMSVRGQLATAPGIVGYALLAHPFARDYWTLSAWESEAALAEFVRQQPHVDVMAGLRDAMGETGFVQWTAPGSALPPTWKDALARLDRAQQEPR
jgi:heme-degrading monooxygenase HmoA